jgi:hypothetical protein
MAGQVTVTPSAEENQTSAPLVSASELSNLARTGVSITFIGVVVWTLKAIRDVGKDAPAA